MIYLKLFYHFFITGLFSVGGGLATLPFLEKMGLATGWFNQADLAQIFAISESTPGPIGVNMAVYIGFQEASFLGSIVAVAALITPSIVIIIIISKMLEKFKNSFLVKSALIGLKLCSTALIASALISISSTTFINSDYSNLSNLFNYKSLLIALIILFVFNFKKTKKMHPIFVILFGAFLGILFN